MAHFGRTLGSAHPILRWGEPARVRRRAASELAGSPVDGLAARLWTWGPEGIAEGARRGLPSGSRLGAAADRPTWQAQAPVPTRSLEQGARWPPGSPAPPACD